MSFDLNKPVSLEEYNAALRGSVNVYYEYAINDPAMPKEEAIMSTAEMSEKYLDAVQEFQEAQNTTGVGADEGVRSDETNEMQMDNNAVNAIGIYALDECGLDSGISEVGVDVSSKGGGVDNDSDGLDGGMEV